MTSERYDRLKRQLLRTIAERDEYHRLLIRSYALLLALGQPVLDYVDDADQAEVRRQAQQLRFTQDRA